MRFDEPTVSALWPRWWSLTVRGGAAILFGVISLVADVTSLLELASAWGVYAVMDGAFTVILAAAENRGEKGWRPLLFEGFTGIAAGTFAFVWPAMTAGFLLSLIAGWGVITGIAAIAAAIRLRREVVNEWMLATSGVLSILLGGLLALLADAGSFALVSMIGLYSVVFGALLVALSLRLRRWGTRSSAQRMRRPIGSDAHRAAG
jgi:uncharacterized membrane protein HdeD (DUF308 family)